MGEHSPGPWKVIPLAGRSATYWTVYATTPSGAPPIVLMDRRSDSTARPDAHLIAAAPELLACLREATAFVADRAASRAEIALVERCEAWINRAEGRWLPIPPAPEDPEGPEDH